MELTTGFILGVLQIALLDLALCGDNIGVIALATRNLSGRHAKLASLIGISGAIFLRIYFAACLSVFLRIKWLPLRFIGGIILVKVTWDLIKPQEDSMMRSETPAERFWDAVLSVVIADISMSLDNVLAIAGAANGNILLIIFGILLNIPIIFFGSQVVVNMMRRYPMAIYIGGAILAFTSIRMIVEDPLFLFYTHISEHSQIMLPYAGAVCTILYGIFRINNDPVRKQLKKHKLKNIS